MFLGMVKSSFPPTGLLAVVSRGHDAVRTVVVEVLGAPEVVVALSGIWVLRPGVLVNLEELAGTIGSGSILNLGHVCEDGTPVSTTKTLLLAVTGVVLVHLDSDCVTSLKVALSLSGSRANVA